MTTILEQMITLFSNFSTCHLRMVFCNKAHGSDRNLGKDTGRLPGGKESTVAP